jgi:putative DNA primase/helicase
MARSKPPQQKAAAADNGIPYTPYGTAAPPAEPAPPVSARPAPAEAIPFYSGADLPREELVWIWPSYIPRGVPMVIYGPTSRGKSTVVRCMAAAVTRGVGLPGMPATDPGSVLWYAREENYRTTLRPRLEAAGAAMSLVYFPEERRAGGRKHLTILDQARLLQQDIERTRAALVVFDPISSFVGGEVAPWSNEAAMLVMEVLHDIGTLTACSFLGIMQPKKGGRGGADEQISGGMEWMNRPRVVFKNVPHPDAKDECYLIPQKTSLADPPPSFRWRRVVKDGISVCEWGEACNITAENVATGGEPPEEEQATQDAVCVLRELLSQGPQLVKDIDQRAQLAGLSMHQMRRARVKLGARFSQEGGNDAKAFYWFLEEGSKKV